MLSKAKELGLQTIGLCTVSDVSQRNFPSDLGAHIALSKAYDNSDLRAHFKRFYLILGTIRKFLEANNREIVILCLEQHECGIYEVLAPLYFPRNQLEESTALWQLPKNISGITGELSISDRQIRITRNPQHTIMMLGSELNFYLNNVKLIKVAEKDEIRKVGHVSTPVTNFALISWSLKGATRAVS